MALVTPYVTLAEADVYLVDRTSWEDADDDVKNNALFWGRIYIDSIYNCPDLIDDPDNPTDQIKFANALLAEDWIQGNLLNTSGTTEPTVKMKRVKAGSVESETEYLGGTVNNPQQDVDALLSSECSKRVGIAKMVTRV